MQPTSIAAPIAKESPVEPQVDLAQLVAALVARLQADPEDEAVLSQLLAAVENWLADDGFEPPPDDESATHSTLARWLSHLSRGGSVVHYGRREGNVAAELAGTGACVASYLDHPGRAIVAAIRYGAEAIQFGTLDQSAECPLNGVDLVVVETAGVEPTVPIEQARGVLRAGGWLAVLGSPVAIDLPGLVDAGRFCVDETQVRPVTTPTEVGLSLYRFAAPSAGPAPQTTPEPQDKPSGRPLARTALEEILNRRGEPNAQELALQQRASQVIETPIPSKELIDWVGGGTPQTYHNIGLVNFHQLSLYCQLQPWHRILEPGCGCGRNARPLAPYLDPQRGAYSGFDIHAGAIDWATQNITQQYPHVKFVFANIRNSNYNPNGVYSGDEFVFPYESESFDVVFMPSVFTHMTRDELQHYAAEIERVLKPGGLLLSWHFLLDDRSRRGIEAKEAQIEFLDYDEVSMAMLPDNPCAAIAFDEKWVLECYEELGLRAQTVVHGRWSGRETNGYFPDYQDRILARKPD